MCSLPTALLPLNQWLHFKGPFCQAPEVCERHYSHRHDQGWRRVCLQTGGVAAGCLVQSEQPGAKHSQNFGDDSGLQEEPPCSPPLTIMESTVAAVETFRFLGTTISQDLKWDNHTDSIAKKAQQRLYFLRQLRKFNLPQELLKQFYSAIMETVLCSSIIVWFGLVQLPKQTSEDYNGQSGLLRGLPVPISPASKKFTPPEWGKGLRK